jgi:signal transduction histidine kinase
MVRAMPVSSTTFVRTTIALLAIGFFAVFAIVAASLWLAARTDIYAGSLSEVLRIRRETFTVISLVQNAETGQRGYLLTQEEPYLEPYFASVRSIDEEFAQLRRLIEVRPEFSEEVERLAALVREKLAELEGTVQLARSGRMQEALRLVRTGRGEAVMDAVRAASADLLSATDAAVAVSTADLTASARDLTWVLIIGGAVILAVVGGSGWVAWRYTKDLERARVEVILLNEGLEERVRERTADLERANEEIQRFAYIVSHDLRAPLVNIMGFTSELETGLASLRKAFDAVPPDPDDSALQEARLALEEEMPEAIGFIRSSTARMDNLINAILKLSREGRRKLTPERIDMAALLATAADSVRHQVAAFEGDIEVAAPMPDVVSDRLALEQVFGNLIDNAVKYLEPSRAGRIVVHGRQLVGRVEYEVSDNGRGIAPEDHERIFELFRRSGLQDRPGEGIGLSHVRALVRRLGGTIALSSELGKGTTFRVSLPRTLPAAQPESA